MDFHGYSEEMRKNKMITKGCPQCEVQVPVACKACSCGHSFFIARRASAMQRLAMCFEHEVRRTERVKREKPNYFDVLEYDNLMKKKCVTPIKPRSGGSSTDEMRDDEDTETEQKTVGRKSSEQKLIDPKHAEQKSIIRNRRIIKVTEEEDEDPTINLSPERMLQFSIELAEINRKIYSASWKPEKSRMSSSS